MIKKDGFLLLQLSLCLALIALLCMYTIPSINFLDGIMARMQLELLYATIRRCQCHAISQQKETKITFDITANSYTFENHVYQLSDKIIFGAPHDAKGPPSQPSHVIKQAITFANHEIICYPTGIITSGTVYIKTKNDHIAYALSNGISTISHLALYCYKNQWQLIEN